MLHVCAEQCERARLRFGAGNDNSASKSSNDNSALKRNLLKLRINNHSDKDLRLQCEF